MSTSPPRPTLRSLQALRGLAASAVVFEHLHFHSALRQGPGLLPDWFTAGHLGVDLFFVLSGFIILHVHRRDVGQPARLKGYLWRRFVRVWPLLALLNTLKLVYLALGGPGASAYKTEPSVILSSYLCLPHPEFPLLDVAWTLRHEVLFYALFAVAIWGGARLGRWLLGISMLVLSFGLTHPAWPWWALFLASPLNWHFLMGLAVAELVLRRVPSLIQSRIAIGVGLLALFFGARWHLASGLVEPRLLFAAGAAALVYGLVQYERIRPLWVPRLLETLGDASYSLYLWHGFVIAGLLALWPYLPQGLTHWPRSYLLVVTLLAFASSIALYRWVEAPLLAWLKPRGPGGRRSGSQTSP